MTNVLNMTVSFLVILTWLANAALAEGQKPVPARTVQARITAVVQRHFAADKSYAAGDLISRSDVEPIINELLEMGFQVADNEELYDAILPDADRLVRLLKTPAGIKFMRSVAAIPEVYDRLERLSWTEAGRKLIGDLIARPDGPQLLKNLSTPAGAKAAAAVFGNDSRGKNFLLPTGHVHTANELLARLIETYAKPAQPAAKLSANPRR